MRSVKKLRGFSLVEVMVALAVFAIIMAATSQIFAKSFSSYRSARNVEKDVENAQYILNSLSKELRTASVVSPSSSSTVSSIQFFDHSQELCIRYRISGGALQVAKASADDVDDCDGMTLSSFSTISSGTVSGSFAVVPTDPSTGAELMGKVTVALTIQEATGHSVSIQTTASLRDYGTAGF